MTENKTPSDVLDYAGLKSENEQLKQRLDAVVAECAHVKDISNWSLKTGMTASRDAFHVGCDAEDCLRDAVHTMLKHLPTPNVTAALAEVEAKAIEKFISKKLKQLEAMHPDTHAFGATAMSIRAQINELQAYVVELREGRV